MWPNRPRRHGGSENAIGSHRRRLRPTRPDARRQMTPFHAWATHSSNVAVLTAVSVCHSPPSSFVSKLAAPDAFGFTSLHMAALHDPRLR